MTNKAIESELDRIIREYVFGLSEEESEPEEKTQEMPELKTELFQDGLCFSIALDNLFLDYQGEFDEETGEEKNYTLVAKHPKLDKGIYFTILEACEEEGIKTVTYPYLAAVDAEGNELEDINFPNEAWFDRHWELHKIPLN